MLVFGIALVNACNAPLSSMGTAWILALQPVILRSQAENGL
jgi:hypothetical protein